MKDNNDLNVGLLFSDIDEKTGRDMAGFMDGYIKEMQSRGYRLSEIIGLLSVVLNTGKGESNESKG